MLNKLAILGAALKTVNTGLSVLGGAQSIGNAASGSVNADIPDAPSTTPTATPSTSLIAQPVLTPLTSYNPIVKPASILNKERLLRTLL